MIMVILRGVFVVLATAVAMLYILGAQQGLQLDAFKVMVLLLCTLGLSAVVIAVDVYTPNKKLSAVSGVFLGLLAGLLAAYALSFVVDLVGLVLFPQIDVDLANVEDRQKLTEVQRRHLAYLNLLQGAKVIIGLITCYVGITLVLQTKDDFRFVIPYVEFAKQIRGNRPVLVDTSVIIDGRIVDIVETNVLQGTIIVPRFVLNELQLVADSSDKLKRERGRRGLDILQKLQATPSLDIHIEEADAEGANVDQKLVAMAQEMKARLMTNDFNLKKVAELRGVDIINLNDLATALRPVVLPGEKMTVRIQKPGEGPGQGVGYLDDGTMVVVENARSRIGSEVQFVVTSNYQTSAGRMIFGQAEDGDGRGGGASGKGGGKSDDAKDGAAKGGGDRGAEKSNGPAGGAPSSRDTTADHEHDVTAADRDAGRPRPSRRGTGRNPRRG